MKLKLRKPVIGLSTSERIFGGLIDHRPLTDPDGESECDLLGDVFFANYKNRATLVEIERVPGREVNHAIMDMTISDPGWNNSGVAGNVPASIAASSALFTYLRSNEVIEDALQKQRQAEEKKKEADKLRQKSGQPGANGDEIERANALDEEAERLISSAVKKVDKTYKDPLGKVAITRAVKQAAKEGEKVSAFMRAWGISESDATSETADKIVTAANTTAMKIFAEILGRAKGLAKKTIDEVKAHTTTAISEYRKTKNLQDVTFLNRLMMSPQAPESLRLTKIRQWSTGGLFGVVPKTSPERRGSSLHMIDESGSMGNHGTTLEKAIAIGTAMAVRDELEPGRYYEMAGFASCHRKGDYRWASTGEIDFDSFPAISSNDDLDDHIRWAGECLNGGTDFDAAFQYAIRRLTAIKQMGVDGCDLVFYSDGICELSDEIKNEFAELKTELSIRMIFIQFGNYPNKEVEELADAFIRFPDSHSIDMEQLVVLISKLSAEHFFDSFGGD